MTIEHQPEHNNDHIQRDPEQVLELGRCVVVVAGPNLSGKTTLSDEVSGLLNVPILDIDKSWRAEWGTLDKRPEMPIVYQFNQEKAKPFIDAGGPVIITATYSKPEYHQMLQQFAQENDCPVRVFVLGYPEGIDPKAIIDVRMQARLDNPNDVSDVRDVKKALEILSFYRPMPKTDPEKDPEERVRVQWLDATTTTKENAELVVRSLADLLVKN